MTTPSPKLGLAVPSQVDPFSTADIAANWGKIDAAPGTHICTSTTRPTWTNAQAGRKIYETNTNLEWVWDGAAWKRLGGTGILKRSDASFAIGERTTPFSTTSNTGVRAVTVLGVVVPDGNRPLRIDVAWRWAKNTDGNFSAWVYRSNTNASGPVLQSWIMSVSTSDNFSGGHTFWCTERNGLSAGSYDWSFQINSPAGTSTLDATVASPITIMVTEL